jgi:four helix bundle protein
VKSFEELDVWRKAHELVLAAYRVTAKFPGEERFGVVSQLRRAASSIPANIAEGFGRRSTKDFVRYLEIASGSLEEVRYFLRLGKDLQYLEETEFKSLRGSCDEVGRLLGGLGQALRRKLV